ncbi:MAG: hypothetical protein N2A40_02660, partial [Desulfobulbaceae bacterium]
VINRWAWEEKSTTNRREWEPTAFVQEGETLPAYYSGTDPVFFLDTFKSKIAYKGEFETIEEFAKRTANKDDLLSPINTSDLYAFRMNDIDIKYDADAQVYLIRYRCGKSYPWESLSKTDGWPACKVASVHRDDDTYVASNAFGASRVVKRTRGIDFALAIVDSNPWLSNEYKYRRISVPLEKARDLKDKELAVLFVGRVIEAKLFTKRSERIEPTIDSPRDLSIREEAVPFGLEKVFFYVLQTGEILWQYPSKVQGAGQIKGGLPEKAVVNKNVFTNVLIANIKQNLTNKSTANSVQDISSKCSAFGSFANTVMEGRQANTLLSDGLKLLDDIKVKDPVLGSVMEDIIMLAYQQPSYQTLEDKARAAVEFKNATILGCTQSEKKK